MSSHKKYDIIKASCLDVMRLRLDEMSKRGWELVGEVSYNNGEYVATLYKSYYIHGNGGMDV